MSYKETELYKMLKRVLRDPIVVMVEGDWRTGKTDSTLLCSYLAKKWGIVDKIGSNIFTYNNPEVDFVDSTGGLKKWMHANKLEKIYILDEALKTIYRRKAMSKLTIKIITEIMPEVSKGHTRLMILTQINKLDQDVLHPAFHRATWKKLNKKTMECRSKHYPFRIFYDLPASPIKFDKDLCANFFDKEMSKVGDSSTLPPILRVCASYSKGDTLDKIGKENGLHRQQVKRMLQKGLKWFTDNYEEPKAPEMA